MCFIFLLLLDLIHVNLSDLHDHHKALERSAIVQVLRCPLVPAESRHEVEHQAEAVDADGTRPGPDGLI